MTAPSRVVAAPQAISVGIGQFVVARDPATQLVSYGLGSCVGIAAWDPLARVAGMLHVLLPEPAPGAAPVNLARFATTGVPLLLCELERAGAVPRRMRFVAAGGAHMLGKLSAAQSAVGGIGERNAAAVVAILREHGLTCAAQRFGGTVGRTIGLVVATGEVWLRATGDEPHAL